MPKSQVVNDQEVVPGELTPGSGPSPGSARHSPVILPGMLFPPSRRCPGGCASAAVLARPGFVRAAPTHPGTFRGRLPSASPPATTGSAVQVSHLHSNNSASWRTDASIKLSSVASSLKTVSARAMLTAMINGETDPLRLADLAKGRMRRKIPDLAQALTGHFDANHARLARSMLRQLDLVDQALAELDAVIVDACQPWAHQIELLQTIPGVGGRSRR